MQVNKARHELFQKKYTRENKIIDLALLSPYHSTLVLDLSRCNYVACLWKASALANLNIPTPCQYGWTSEYEIQWLDEIFLADYEELLTDGNDNESESDSDDNYDIGPDEESEDSDVFIIRKMPFLSFTIHFLIANFYHSHKKRIVWKHGPS